MNISMLKVMRSAAGFYLGHSYYDQELEGDFPYDRQTDYMSEEEATAMLVYWNKEEEEAEIEVMITTPNVHLLEDVPF